MAAVLTANLKAEIAAETSRKLPIWHTQFRIRDCVNRSKGILWPLSRGYLSVITWSAVSNCSKRVPFARVSTPRPIRSPSSHMPSYCTPSGHIMTPCPCWRSFLNPPRNLKPVLHEKRTLCCIQPHLYLEYLHAPVFPGVVSFSELAVHKSSLEHPCIMPLEYPPPMKLAHVKVTVVARSVWKRQDPLAIIPRKQLQCFNQDSAFLHPQHHTITLPWRLPCLNMPEYEAPLIYVIIPFPCGLPAESKLPTNLCSFIGRFLKTG